MDPVFAPTPAPQPQSPPSPDYYGQPSKSGQHRRLLPIGLITLAVLIALSIGAFWWLRHHHAASTRAQTGTTTASTNSPQATPDTVTNASTTQYVSNGKDLNLTFAYPSAWSVTPPSSTNISDQAITVSSPLVSIADASNKSVTGRVVVSIRPGGATLSELASNASTAGQASAQIGYDKPTAAQHQYPFLTYIHLAGGANANSVFEEVIITGIMSFAKDQAISSYSLSQLDPIISARFYACSDQACSPTTATPLSITNSIWVSDATCMQTLALFKSLQLN